jgi:hypothetical protein
VKSEQYEPNAPYPWSPDVVPILQKLKDQALLVVDISGLEELADPTGRAAIPVAQSMMTGGKKSKAQ